MTTKNLPKVLVVDDNQDNANIIRQYLEIVVAIQSSWPMMVKRRYSVRN